MRCPRCKIRSMVPCEKGETTLDICPTCLGIWFDPGEMGIIKEEGFDDEKMVMENAELRIQNEERKGQNGNAEFGVRNAEYTKEKKQKYDCTLCGVALVPVNYQYTGNRVFHCRECNGTFSSLETAKKIHKTLEMAEKRAGSRDGKGIVGASSNVGAVNFSGISPLFSREKASIPLPAIIPLSSDLKIGIFPAVTAAILAIFLIVFILGDLLATSPVDFVSRVGIDPGVSLTGQVIPLISYGFIHVNIFPLIVNSCFIYFVGAPLEERLSPAIYIVFFVGGTVLAAAVHLLAKSGNGPIVGAAGGVSALLGAYAVTFPLVRVKAAFFGTILSLPSYMMVVAWLLFAFFTSGDILFSFLNPYGPGFVPQASSFLAGAVAAFTLRR